MSATATTEKKYLKWYQKLAYGSGDLASNCSYGLVSSFVLLYLTGTLGLDSAIIGSLMLASKVLDGISDVIFGTLIDRTHSKLGKARPWMLYGYIGCAITLVAIFAIPTSLGQFAQYAWFLIAYTLLNAVFHTANNIAYSALTALVTKNSAEQVEMGSYRFMFAFATSLLIQSITLGAVSALGGGAAGWRTVAIIYAIIGCCMMFAAGLSWKYIIGAISAAAVAVAAAFAFFSDKIGKGYQWYRILAVIDPDNKTGWAPSETIWKNIIYQQQRGEIALGSGGIFGNGLFTGRYYSVPNAHNDFILSWIGNVAGFVGCCVVLGVLLAIIIKTFATGAGSEDMLGSFICAGIGGALLAQIAVNVGMNLRVLPVIGVTLPFYSAGGSSVLMLYICVGLVLSVYTHNTKKLFG